MEKNTYPNVKVNDKMIRPGRLKPYYFYRYIRWKIGITDPITAVAKITTQCNLNCSHCPWKNWDRKEMDTEEWFRVLKEAREKGAAHLVIEGGEPTMRDDLAEIISYAKDLGMLVMVITNGTNDLRPYDPDNFWLSVDGLREVHNKQRGREIFDDVVRNIEHISDRPKIVGCTLSQINRNQIEDYTDFFSPLVDWVWFNFMYPYEGVDDISLSKKEKKEAAKEILRLKEEYLNVLNSRSYLEDVCEDFTCFPFLTLLIGPDGTFQQSCTIEQLEECRCEDCDLACYSELSHAMQMDWDSIEFLKKTTGFRRENLLWLGRK